MSTAALFQSIHQVTEAYQRKLEQANEAHFQLSPPTGAWSYSEVYSHIFDLSLLSLKQLEKCLTENGRPKKTPFITKLILFFGRFPPVIKFKVPKSLESRVKKISKGEAESLMGEFLKELETYKQRIEHADPSSKAAHPRLGFLNAAQWLRFIEIHLKHHLKQLERIDKRI
jgi:hypothetical protein